jgi:hypothetical protein
MQFHKNDVLGDQHQLGRKHQRAQHAGEPNFFAFEGNPQNA